MIDALWEAENGIIEALKNPFFVQLADQKGFVDQSFTKWRKCQGSIRKLWVGLLQGGGERIKHGTKIEKKPSNR